MSALRHLEGFHFALGITVLLMSGLVFAAPPPNIVVLFADDLGYGDLGSYGHPYIRTPHLDQLAAEGQRWTDFYVAAPVCSPSRGALLTGRLPTRTGLYGKQIAVMFPNASNGMPESEITLAEALRVKGYATGIIGKWHLGDHPDFYPTRHGFDYWYGLPYSNDMAWAGEPTFVELMALVAKEGPEAVADVFPKRFGRYFDPKVEYWNVPLIKSQSMDDGFSDQIIERPVDQRELTKRHTEEAVSFIERNKDQPFFLYVPYSMPHTPLFRSDDFADRSQAGLYGDVIEELDWSVGAISQKLRELDLARNTLLVFTSDNGPWLLMNTHGGSAGLLRDGKGTTHEGGMRVPTIFWWPDRIAPGVVSEIGSAMDIYTTALNLAGIDAPEAVDGLDLSGALFGVAQSPRKSVFYYRAGELRAYRKGPYKLRLITEGVYQQPPPRTVHEVPLLYHLLDDPSERFDIAEQNPKVVADMLKDVAAHLSSFSPKESVFDRQYDHLQ